MRHILSNRAHQRLIEWAKGPQDTPAPIATSFCKQWRTLASRPGEWQSFDQWQQSQLRRDNCPACEARAQGHLHIISMIHAGAERARREANGQASNY